MPFSVTRRLGSNGRWDWNNFFRSWQKRERRNWQQRWTPWIDSVVVGGSLMNLPMMNLIARNHVVTGDPSGGAAAVARGKGETYLRRLRRRPTNLSKWFWSTWVKLENKKNPSILKSSVCWRQCCQVFVEENATPIGSRSTQVCPCCWWRYSEGSLCS